MPGFKQGSDVDLGWLIPIGIGQNLLSIKENHRPIVAGQKKDGFFKGISYIKRPTKASRLLTAWAFSPYPGGIGGCRTG
jgi:hypothetical protein